MAGVRIGVVDHVELVLKFMNKWFQPSTANLQAQVAQRHRAHLVFECWGRLLCHGATSLLVCI